MRFSPTNNQLWQLKILFATVTKFSNVRNTLISPEIVISMQQQILNLLDGWEPKLLYSLKSYIGGDNQNVNVNQNKLSSYINFYDVPYKILENFNGHFLEIIENLSNKNLKNSLTISKIIDIINNK